MAVYVDEPRRYDVRVGRIPKGTIWCHMRADTRAELESMARSIGLDPSWIQKPGTCAERYDLVPERRRWAVRLGAVEVTTREFVRGMRERCDAAKA